LTRVWHDDLVRASRIQLFIRKLTTARRRYSVALLLLALPVVAGCVRVNASITISPDDLVSGRIVAAAKPRNDKDPGPQLDPNLPFSRKVTFSKYDRDGYVGSQATFSDLTFAELPELASMNSDAQGVSLSLRRAGDVVILEGRADLTMLTDPDADVQLTVAFPGSVTSTNGDRVGSETVEWKLKPGVVNTMTAQARCTDPSTRSFRGAALWLGLASLTVAGTVALLAWRGRDRSPRFGESSYQPPD
jgi:LppM domain